MARASEKKKKDIEIELIKHVDLISDTKVKGFIMKKKAEKTEREMKKWASMSKSNPDMVMESGSEEDEASKIMQKLTISKKSKKIKKTTT